jgi:pyruvate formate lyase activating enzyme
MTIEIKGMMETSFLDWDGKIVATLFVPKCNFRCPFCQNHELIKYPDKFQTIPFAQIEKFILKNKLFLDGVCITGGEPLVYPDISDLIINLRELDLKIKLDTNGSYPEILDMLIHDKLIDYIAMDVKAPLDSNLYSNSAGVKIELKKIQKSIEIIMNSNVDYEFRSTVVPKLLDVEKIIMISKSIQGANKYVLQQYIPDNALAPEFRKVKPYSNVEINKMAQMCRKHVNIVTVRGLK